MRTMIKKPMNKDVVLTSKTNFSAKRGTPVSTAALSTLALLEIMCSLPAPAGVSEIAQMIGWSRGTTHRRLVTLLQSGFVEQNRLGQYSISLITTRLGNAALEQAGLGVWLQSGLEQLVEKTNETATIAVLHRASALIVQRAESPEVLNANIRIGTRMPLTYNASALILQAFAQRAAERADLRASGFEFASETEIARVREAGVAVSVDEFVKDLSAVALPIAIDAPGGFGALTIVGPTQRLDVKAAHTVLSVAAEQISARRGVDIMRRRPSL